MAEAGFGYQAVLAQDNSITVVSLIAFEVRSDGPLRAIIWDVPRRAWVYAPDPAARFLFDDRYFDRTRSVSRDEAEQIAVDSLGSVLPREDELHHMCDEG
jgi:hypothetical protein